MIVLVAACAGTGAAPSGGPTSGVSLPGTSAASPVAAATPAPTDLLAMSIAFLPDVKVNTSKVKVACDQATLGTAASMPCNDIVSLTARVGATMSNNPLKQVAVTKPADNPGAIQVTFWVKAEAGNGDTAFTSTIDPADETVTFPVADPTAVFPTTM